MCCGKGRQQLTGLFQATGSAKARPTAAATRPLAPLIGRSSTGMLQYRYMGPTSLTVTSPVTGRQYRFDRPGAVQHVDARDRFLLDRTPHVKPAARRAG